MAVEVATLAGGCFWCTEAIFRRLKGVQRVVSGYAGGTTENPNYYQVSDGDTGHAEAIQIEFDPQVISFDKLLEVFWHTHNPTTLNQQGFDKGTQYRSVIFYHSPKQQSTAEASRTAQMTDGPYKGKVVTEVVPFTQFYAAEDYHQNYYENNKTQLYCSFVIDPKLKKLLELYATDLKPEYSTSASNFT